MTIKFAPLWVPWERRFQMLAILLYVNLILFGGLSVILFSLYAVFYTTYLRWIYIGYLSWFVLFDINACDKGGRPSQWVRSWRWWVYMANYFPVKLVKLPWGKLDPKKNYLFCCFPHGMMATGAFLSILTEANGISKIFPNHTTHMNTLRTNLLFPITRELFLRLGAISASADSLNNILSRPEGGNISALVVGGAQEAFHTAPNHYRLVLKNRKGFVKIALRNGSPLVPVMSFGEPDILSQIEFKEGTIINRLQLLVKKLFGFVPIIPAGRGIFQYNFGILPRRRKITVVVGKPIHVDKIKHPTEKQINAVHAEFIEKLNVLFESEKKKYLQNSNKIHLEIL